MAISTIGTNGLDQTNNLELGATGNVGIGTATPQQKLDVHATSGANAFWLTSDTGTNPVYSRYANTGGYVYMGRDGSAGTDFGAGAYTSAIWCTGAYPFIIGTNATERMRIDSSGNVLVNSTTNGAAGNKLYVSATQYPLGVNNSTGGAGVENVRFYNAGTAVGTISTTTTATAYNTSSDYRLKENQAPLEGSGAFIDALKPTTWNWYDGSGKGVGFIAHEVQEVSPSSVTGEKDAVDEEGNPVYQAMEYGSAEFIANIVAELQSLRKRVAQLEAIK